MVPVLVALALHRVIEVDWFLTGGQDYFRTYDFATGTD